MRASRETTVKSADRALDLLELLCSTGHPLSHTEIAAALSIPKSSLSQLLGNLERRGYLQFQSGPNLYELGPAVGRLAEGSKMATNLLQVAQNVVDVLAKSTQETASFYKRRGDFVERMTVANSHRPLRYWMQVGETMPLHATSGGKAILAALEANERDSVVGRLHLSHHTPHTITSRSALRQELRAIAHAGISYSREEFEEGVIGIGVAILRPTGAPEGSLSVVLPAARNKPAHRKSVIEALQNAKERLEAEIGRVAPDRALPKPAQRRSGGKNETTLTSRPRKRTGLRPGLITIAAKAAPRA
jgi:DNA-binding IclR family transcriptional regulator